MEAIYIYIYIHQLNVNFIINAWNSFVLVLMSLGGFFGVLSKCIFSIEENHPFDGKLSFNDYWIANDKI